MCFPKAWWVKKFVTYGPKCIRTLQCFLQNNFFNMPQFTKVFTPNARCSPKMSIQLDFDFTHLIVAQTFVLGLMLTPWKHIMLLEQPINLSNSLCPLLCNRPKQKQCWRQHCFAFLLHMHLVPSSQHAWLWQWWIRFSSVMRHWRLTPIIMMCIENKLLVKHDWEWWKRWSQMMESTITNQKDEKTPRRHK